MRRAFSLSSLGLAAAAALAATAASPPSAAATSADECVAIYRTAESTGIQFDLQNNCDKRLSCSLGWTLQCETDTGKVVKATRRDVTFTLAPSTSHQEVGSAAACSGNWRIDAVTWSCAPTP